MLDDLLEDGSSFRQTRMTLLPAYTLLAKGIYQVREIIYCI
jgi:hypothetical protein